MQDKGLSNINIFKWKIQDIDKNKRMFLLIKCFMKMYLFTYEATDGAFLKQQYSIFRIMLVLYFGYLFRNEFLNYFSVKVLLFILMMWKNNNFVCFVKSCVAFTLEKFYEWIIPEICLLLARFSPQWTIARCGILSYLKFDYLFSINKL